MLRPIDLAPCPVSDAFTFLLHDVAFSSTFPCSYSMRMAYAVNCLEIDPTSDTACCVAETLSSMLAKPPARLSTSCPPRTTPPTISGICWTSLC